MLPFANMFISYHLPKTVHRKAI